MRIENTPLENKVHISADGFYISINLVEGSFFPSGTISGNRTYPGNHSWYIDRLVVKPYYRKKGYGTYLLNRFILEVKHKKGRNIVVYLRRWTKSCVRQLSGWNEDICQTIQI